MFLFFVHMTVSLSGIHTFQRMNGCYLDEQTGDYNAFNQYGYDGKDLISFDLETMTWIAPQHQTVITKHNWNRDGDGQFWKFALTEECRQFLQMYLAYGESALQTPGKDTGHAVRITFFRLSQLTTTCQIIFHLSVNNLYKNKFNLVSISSSEILMVKIINDLIVAHSGLLSILILFFL